MSAFRFIDRITEVKKNESLTAFYTLKGTEEFLLDHFKWFPVMPGVLLLESLKQAAIALLLEDNGRSPQYRLAAAQDVRFGQFVKPGSELKIFVQKTRKEGNRTFFQGRIELMGGTAFAGGRKALTADLTLEPIGI